MGFLSSAWDICEQSWKHLRQRRGAELRARHSARRAALGQALRLVDRGYSVARSLGDGDKEEYVQRPGAFSRSGRIGAR